MLTALVTTYNRSKMLDRCLRSLEGVADRAVIANGHIRREVRANMVQPFSTDDTEATIARWSQNPVMKVEYRNRMAESFTDQLNYLLKEACLGTGDWFLWICDDEALLGDKGVIRRYLEIEPTDFLTLTCWGRAGPDNPVLYSRFIRKAEDTEFFPVHWQVIHKHQHIDLYKKQLSKEVVENAEIWDLEKYGSESLPSLQEARAWYGS